MPVDLEHPNEAALARLDALLAAHEAEWWDTFYEDRAKPCPFFGTAPDESLADWVSAGWVRSGRALDLGCGNARNAIFLARQGYSVDAVDYSPAAINWARERAQEAGVDVSLTCKSVFDLGLKAGGYDFVYDSGCFHHIPPHRRARYVELVSGALKPGGWFGLTCFRPEGGSRLSDDEVYECRSMGGGLGYTQERLREIWSRGFHIRTLRQMRKPAPGSSLFGEPFLWVLLACKT